MSMECSRTDWSSGLSQRDHVNSKDRNCTHIVAVRLQLSKERRQRVCCGYVKPSIKQKTACLPATKPSLGVERSLQQGRLACYSEREQALASWPVVKHRADPDARRRWAGYAAIRLAIDQWGAEWMACTPSGIFIPSERPRRAAACIRRSTHVRQSHRAWLLREDAADVSAA